MFRLPDSIAEGVNYRLIIGLGISLIILILMIWAGIRWLADSPLKGRQREDATVMSAFHEGTLPVVRDAADNEANASAQEQVIIPTMENIHTIKDMESLLKYLYTIDQTAYVDESVLDIDALLAVDLRTNLMKDPKILIIHTHSQETFIDSRPDETDDTIVGVGSVLADILATQYGIGVVHDLSRYDVVDGRTERGNSYERMEPSVRHILEMYPTIEVVLDLHRDGVPDDMRLVTEVNGKPTARLMFFNGVSCESNGDRGRKVDGLPNPFLKDNLAFSLHMQLATNEAYPGLTRRLYIKPYRYSLHMKPKSLLVEVGANTSTVQEAKNAMGPLAEVLVKVLGQ